MRAEAEIDTASRMIQLVARVLSKDTDTELSVGLFVEAEISGLAVNDIITLPRSAIRNSNSVLVVDENDRLRFRKVTTLRHYKDSVLISAGLEGGERVCLSNIQTAVEGMQVNPIFAERS